MKTTSPHPKVPAPGASTRRGGAALIIVLAMTGMLMFLGFFFFSFISAERNSAAWFALSANGQVSESDYFDFALQQVLIGPPDDLKNSALYGRKWSLIPNMIGTIGPDLKPTDLHPFSGQGIHVTYQADGEGLPSDASTANDQFNFDYGADGALNPNRKILNFSPAANPDGGVPFTPLGQQQHVDFVPDFQPDAGYTYPDINSLFLGYFSLVDINNDPGNPSFRSVWIPSFHRPQYLPRDGSINLYTDSAYRNRVLRPHQNSLVQMRRWDGSAVVRGNLSRYVAAGGFNTTFTTAPSGPATGFEFPLHKAGIWHNVSTSNELDAIEYDVDADGISANGREAILLDLDHRAEVLPDGTKRIPMFAITIMDADGLINLNAAGNLYGEDDSLVHGRTAGSPEFANEAFGDGRFITRSNLGLSPCEINLGRALYRPLPGTGGLTAPPAGGFYENIFGYTVGTAQVTQVDMANMEVARLMIGVADGNTGTTTDRVAGRWGEVERLDAAIAGAQPPNPPLPRAGWSGPLFPVPGQGLPTSLADDNNNYGTGGGKALVAGTYNEDPIFGPLGIGIPSVVHPIDITGVGVNSATDIAAQSLVNQDIYAQIQTNNNLGRVRRGQNLTTLATNPQRWPSYGNYWERQVDPAILVSMREASGVVPWFNGTNFEDAAREALQPTTTGGNDNLFLADEPNEIILEPAFRNTDFDSLLGIGEMQYLHLNNADWSVVGLTSRLENLVKYNFERTDYLNLSSAGPPAVADPIDDSWLLRSQFTTDSWDRWEFSLTPAVGANLASGANRGWEFNPITGDAQRLVFPPRFNGADRFTANDPFRPELRQWLTIELGRDETFANFPLPQRRLNINRLLDKDDRGKFRQRHLTPHPMFLAGDTADAAVFELMYSDTGSVVRSYDQNNPVPGLVAFGNMSGNKSVQEWWAKYDRQRLARDIYVLLYTLGAGDHAFDPTSNPYPVTATTDLDGDGINDQVKAMAQFAVNYVDALDRDSVITEFVYDTNLSNGWGITGEKVDTTGEFVDATGETASVFGVEAQSLTLNETLWITSQGSQTDNEALTLWDDTQPDRHFLYMELLNASPFPVSLEAGTWRIRRIDIDISDPDNPVENTIAGFRITDNLATSQTTGTGEEDTANVVEGGRYYTIGHHDGTNPVSSGTDQRSSDFRIGPGGTNFQTIAPYTWAEWRHTTAPAPSAPTDDPAPWVDLDLTWDGGTEEPRSRSQDNQGKDVTGPRVPGYLLNETNKPAVNLVPTLVLERRLNPSLSSLNVGDEDLLDRSNGWVEVDRMVIDRKNFDPANPAYETLTSFERREPLSPTLPVDYAGAAVGQTSQSYNSLRGNNDAISEVNGAPAFTLWQPHFDRDFTSVYELLSVPLFGPEELRRKLASADNRLTGVTTAYTMFAVPDPTGNVDNRNHWYRLFEFLEVPSEIQMAIREQLPIPRSPAKINLNTVRHPGVLAALIDDDYHLANFRTPAAVITDSDAAKFSYPYLQLTDPHEANRHWYEQFLFSRDRIDPISNLPLPGIPGSRPFRPFSYIDTTGNLDSRASVEHTLLRAMPFNGTGGPGVMPENTNPTAVPGSNYTEADLENAINDALSRRGLFEARTNNDAILGGTSVDGVDYHTRQRLLSKIGNNTTVRSNVFYCWIYVQFHEAAEDEYGNVQVGGVLTGPEHTPKRAFFVIDRSKLEEAYDPRTRTFDWKKFVSLRKVLN